MSVCPFARVVVLLCFVSSTFYFFRKLLHFYLPATPILALSVHVLVISVLAYFDVVGARTRAFGVKLLWLLCSDFLLVLCSFEVKKSNLVAIYLFKQALGLLVLITL